MIDCPHCRRAPCACDPDVGDERPDDGDAGGLEIDVHAALRSMERRDRAEGWLRPRPLES